jgi:hypothetical protein
VATINAAAAMHACRRGRFAAYAAIVAIGLAGCSTNGGTLLDMTNSPLADSTASTPDKPAAASRAKIAIAPVIGAPSTIASQIVAQVSNEIGRQNVAVAKTPNEQVDYTLRGYIVAAREATGTKVSYIWDVTNPTGARVHRISASGCRRRRPRLLPLLSPVVQRRRRPASLPVALSPRPPLSRPPLRARPPAAFREPSPPSCPPLRVRRAMVRGRWQPPCATN